MQGLRTAGICITDGDCESGWARSKRLRSNTHLSTVPAWSVPACEVVLYVWQILLFRDIRCFSCSKLVSLFSTLWILGCFVTCNAFQMWCRTTQIGPRQRCNSYLLHSEVFPFTYPTNLITTQHYRAQRQGIQPCKFWQSEESFLYHGNSFLYHGNPIIVCRIIVCRSHSDILNGGQLQLCRQQIVQCGRINIKWERLWYDLTVWLPA